MPKVTVSVPDGKYCKNCRFLMQGTVLCLLYHELCEEEEDRFGGMLKHQHCPVEDGEIERQIRQHIRVIEELSLQRGTIWKELARDLDQADDEHSWRSVKCRQMAEVEDRIHKEEMKIEALQERKR